MPVSFLVPKNVLANAISVLPVYKLQTMLLVLHLSTSHYQTGICNTYRLSSAALGFPSITLLTDGITTSNVFLIISFVLTDFSLVQNLVFLFNYFSVIDTGRKHPLFFKAHPLP